jgi:DNA-directed RNA polymerase subunit alpha
MADNRRALPYVFDAMPAATEPASTEPSVAPVEPSAVTDASPDLLNTPIDNLELSVRSANCLMNANIEFVGELVQMTEEDLLRTKNAGRKSINELTELLGDMGLRFGMNLGGWQPPQS